MAKFLDFLFSHHERLGESIQAGCITTVYIAQEDYAVAFSCTRLPTMEATAFLAKIDGTRMIPDIVAGRRFFCCCCCWSPEFCN